MKGSKGKVRWARVAGKTAGMVGGGFAGALVALSGEFRGGLSEPSFWVIVLFMIGVPVLFATLGEVWSNQPSPNGEDAGRGLESEINTAQKELASVERERRVVEDALIYLVEHSRVPIRRNEWNRRKQLLVQLRRSGRGGQEGMTDAG